MTRAQRKVACLSLIAAAMIVAPAHSSLAAAPKSVAVQDHAHDFDFLVGKWKVHHWRLNGRLVGSHDWVEFWGTCNMWMTMNGQGTFDENYIGIPTGPYRAVGIRAYDPAERVWSIWWLDARNPKKIEPPVVGNFDFKDGAGTFIGDDVNNGKPVKVRFTWSKITKTSAHWEQAESPDHGKSWEVNWRMDFTRVAP